MHHVRIISTGIVIVSSRVGEAPADNYSVWLVIMRKFWQQRYQSHPNTRDSDSTLTANSANLKGKTLCLHRVSLVNEIGNTDKMTHWENLLYGVMERLPVGWTIGRNAPKSKLWDFFCSSHSANMVLMQQHIVHAGSLSWLAVTLQYNRGIVNVIGNTCAFLSFQLYTLHILLSMKLFI